jgi:hypothetical protein
MMKKLLTIALALVTTISFAQTFVSTSPENKNVVLEEYTGIVFGVQLDMLLALICMHKTQMMSF